MKQHLEKLVDIANELGLTAAQRWMMTALIVLAGKEASISVSFFELASVYGGNVRNVARMIAALAKKPRLLQIEQSRNDSGQAQANRYSFPFLTGAPVKIAPLAPPPADDLGAL